MACDEILVQVIGQPDQVMLATEECRRINVTRNLAVIQLNHEMVNRKYLKEKWIEYFGEIAYFC